ncbi:MAG: ATP-binding protein [Candidatus Omnitrophica bacterium]|nr:ATP-binding protein [Candidatus Omnitrophota bacterium]
MSYELIMSCNLIFSVVTIFNVGLLLVLAGRLIFKRHIYNLLAAFSLLSFSVVEAAKFLVINRVEAGPFIFGASLCLLPLFWLVLSMLLLPARSYNLSRTILSPFFAVVTIAFFVVWWIKPFFLVSGLCDAKTITASDLSVLARYFCVVLVFSLTLSISNLERGFYYNNQKPTKLLFVSSFFFLGPSILIAAQAVMVSSLNLTLVTFASLGVTVGALILGPAVKQGFDVSKVKESSAVHTSVTLFLVGGYLFLVGALIKLFHVFGWNLKTFASFFATVVVCFAFIVLIFSGSIKERLARVMLKNFTRQKYDWQKIWEEFTYKVSLVTDIEQLKNNVAVAVKQIVKVSNVKIELFEKGAPCETEVMDWMLRRGGVFSVEEVTNAAADAPKARAFFDEFGVSHVSPLYGDRKVIGLVGFNNPKKRFVDAELLKILSLQASSVILNCWANQALFEAEKKESVYRLSSFVIHDVKNYINNLSLLVSNKDKFANPEFQKDALYTIDHTITKMRRLVNEFRALRGDVSLDIKSVLAKSLIEEALSDIGTGRLSEVALDVAVDDDLVVFVDAYYMNRVLVNLILNALDAIDNKGKVTVSAVKESGGARVEVSDTGVGMSRDFIENKLFKPFNTTKEKGMGIGLYQCKLIVEKHGATIQAISREGEGTTFVIRLRADREEEKLIAPSSEGRHSS